MIFCKENSCELSVSEPSFIFWLDRLIADILFAAWANTIWKSKVAA